MITKEFKEPYKVICGVCCNYLGESENPEGELGYDGCEEEESKWVWIKKNKKKYGEGHQGNIDW